MPTKTRNTQSHPTEVPDMATIAAEAAARDAELAREEEALARQLRTLAEKRSNIRAAQDLLTRQSADEARAAERAAAAAERASQQEQYDEAIAERTRLFVEIQRLTTELAARIKEALTVDSHIYSAALVLGITTQRAGYAKRALTDFVGRRLSMSGLTDMPRGRSDRNLVGE